MRLVVEISEDTFFDLKKKQNRTEVDNAVLNGAPLPKAGHREYNDIYDHYLCGNCKTVVMDYDNYCPNCGARMVEPQESEDKCKNCEYYRNPDYTRCHECKVESEDKE